MKPLKSIKAGCLPPVKTMRKYCLTRCEDGPKAVRLCQDTQCPLYPYRLGKQPNRSGIGGKCPALPKKPTQVGVENKVGVEAGQAILSRHRLSGEEVVYGPMDLETKGQITIKRVNNQEIVITMRTEN